MVDCYKITLVNILGQLLNFNDKFLVMMSVTDDLHTDISGVNLQVADRVCDGERPVSGHVSSHAIVEGPWPATDRQTAAEEGAGHRNGTQHYCYRYILQI